MFRPGNLRVWGGTNPPRFMGHLHYGVVALPILHSTWPNRRRCCEVSDIFKTSPNDPTSMRCINMYWADKSASPSVWGMMSGIVSLGKTSLVVWLIVSRDCITATLLCKAKLEVPTTHLWSWNDPKNTAKIQFLIVDDSNRSKLALFVRAIHISKNKNHSKKKENRDMLRKQQPSNFDFFMIFLAPLSFNGRKKLYR